MTSGVTLNINYLNPYYTFDGISRDIGLYAQRFDPSAVHIANYSYQNFGAAVNYGVPISASNDQITFGYGYENSTLGVGNAPTVQVLDFFNQYNTAPTSNLIFNQLLLNLGWSHNSLDRAFLPTHGLVESATAQLSEPLSQKNLQYYKLGYSAKWFHPVVGDFVFTSLAETHYGEGLGSNKNLPFFQNFYSGGIGSVRGFSNNTLGPIDSLGNPIGGNLEANGSVAMIFPNYISPNTLRTSWFVDGGNVYDTHASTAPTGGATNPHAGTLRYSTGLNIEWKMPIMGVIDISFAKPINAQPHDQKDWFQFNFGAQF